MKTSRFTYSQIIAILKLAEAGSPALIMPRTRQERYDLLKSGSHQEEVCRQTPEG
jgi:hypothetical protein